MLRKVPWKPCHTHTNKMFRCFGSTSVKTVLQILEQVNYAGYAQYFLTGYDCKQSADTRHLNQVCFVWVTLTLISISVKRKTCFVFLHRLHKHFLAVPPLCYHGPKWIWWHWKGPLYTSVLEPKKPYCFAPHLGLPLHGRFFFNSAMNREQ